MRARWRRELDQASSTPIVRGAKVRRIDERYVVLHVREVDSEGTNGGVPKALCFNRFGHGKWMPLTDLEVWAIVIPPIAEAFSTDSHRLDIQSATREQEVTLQFICERYQGTNGVPLFTFSRDGTKSLIYPPNIRGRIPSLGGSPAIPKNIESQHSAS